VNSAETEPLPRRRPPGTFARLRVLDTYVDKAEPAEVLAYLIESAEEKYGCSVAGISGPYAVAMSKDPALREAFEACDLLIPDGKGYVWGARMLGQPCPERLAIPDLCEQLFAAGNTRGWKVFIYGATEDINAAACTNLRARFPHLAVVEGQHGYNQGPAEEDAVIERIKTGGFQLVVVARPSPEKEKFLVRCCKATGAVGLAAGGYADILAGKTKRAPAFVQALGMEWLYRTAQEPGRLWKRVAVANAQFATRVLWAHFFSRPRKQLWTSTPVQVMAILLAGVAAYSQAINAPYHFDDPEYIQENPTIRSWDGLKQIKVLAFRKLWWLSNAICYRLSEDYGVHFANRPDVRIFRAWNYACHFIAALALYGLMRRCVKALRDPDDVNAVSGEPRELLPFIAAAIFAAHPLTTESVTYISGRDNGQGGMFYLLGLYFAAVAFGRLRASANVISEKPRWPAWFWPAVWSLGCGAASVLTKEIHLTFPVAVGLLYLCFFRGKAATTVSWGVLVGMLAALGALGWGAAGRTDGRLALGMQAGAVLFALGAWLGWRGAKTSFWQRRISVLWATALLFVGLGGVAIAAFPYAYQRTIGALTGYMNSDYVRSLATQAYAVPQMFWRAIVPIKLSIDHDFPSVANFQDSRALLGGAAILVLVIFASVGVWRRWVAGFGILLALLVIAPSNTVIERGDIVSERNFYLVAAGGACLIAWFITTVLQAIVERAARGGGQEVRVAASHEAGLWALVLGCAFVAPFVALTVIRNDDWRDPLKLWSSAREQSPEKMRVLYNFGVASFVRKHYDDAEFAFQTLITLGEERAEKGLFRSDETVQVKCFHLGYARMAELQLFRYSRANRPDDYRPIREVDEIFKRGMTRTAHDPDLALNYAQYLFQLRRFNDAAPVLQLSYNLHTWAGQLHFPMGVAYLECEQFENAREHLQKATEYQVEHSLGVNLQFGRSQRSEPLGLLGLAKLRMKDLAGAKQSLRASIDLHPRGIYLVTTSMQVARNPKLKQLEMEFPDPLAITFSVCRRDVLETVLAAVDEHLQSGAVYDRGTMDMYRTMLADELNRRRELQKKREAFGFKDDPDAE